MNSEHPETDQPPKKRFEPWIVAIFIFFAIVFAANAVMVVLGINSWPGLVAQNHYQKGLQYNQVIDAQKAQDQLGWQVNLNTDRLQPAESGKLSISLNDRENKPVQGAQVEGILFRPLGEGADQRFLLLEERPGLYSATINPAKPGVWDVKIRIQKSSGIDFRYVKRITLADLRNKEPN
ncbi:MAG: FixH family protein [Magnetococcales bacterium]|nr:FixH family protein [Magnetococcales bacterium]